MPVDNVDKFFEKIVFDSFQQFMMSLFGPILLSFNDKSPLRTTLENSFPHFDSLQFSTSAPFSAGISGMKTFYKKILFC